MIVMENVSKVFPGGVRALDGISLEIPRGQWTAVMGPSGSGKTTLLNLLDGLERPTTGRVVVKETDMAGLAPDEAARHRRENIGLVFQQFHLIPYLTAVENVMIAQYYHSLADEKEAAAALERVGLADRLRHLPSQLSGGEQQRVCLARALINDPALILADEPTGNLDEANEMAVLEIFRGLHAAGKTLVVVTHDKFVGARAQRTIHLAHGRIVRDECLA